MAIVNMNQLFDKLKEYIDTKKEGIEVELRELFEEYGLKEIRPYLNEIKTVADNIAQLIPIGNNLVPLVAIGNNMDAVLAIPQQLADMSDLVTEGEGHYNDTVDEAEFAHRWSQQAFQVPVEHPNDVGNPLGFSAYHWSEIAKAEASALTFMGSWKPSSGAYPTPNAHGDYWYVTESGWFDNIYWKSGDRLAWYDDTITNGWLHLENTISWQSIVDRPLMYTPRPHFHSEYFQVDNMTDYTEGPAFAGLGVKLNLEGLVDNSMIKLPVVYLVGKHTPIHGSIELEYPDTDGKTHGATWYVGGITDRFTFQTGDLTGESVKVGDYMVWAENGWIKVISKLYPEEFYRRDGSYPMLGDITANNFKLVGLADATELTDGVNVRYLDGRLADYLDETNFISESTGSADQFKPILLNEHGYVDGSMFSFNALNPQGGWNPEGPDGEYPPSPASGDYWYVYGVGDDGHTYTTGDLTGRYVSNNDYMLYTQSGWYLKAAVNLDPNDFYRIDGSTPLSHPLNAGGNTLSHMANALIDTDAVSLGQMNAELAKYALENGDIAPIQIKPQGPGSALDADTVDGKHAIDFAEVAHTHSVDQITGQGHTADGSGFDSDLLDGLHADAFFKVADGVDWTELTSVPATFTPPTSSETIIGGLRVWEDVDTNSLYLATTPYAP